MGCPAMQATCATCRERCRSCVVDCSPSIHLRSMQAHDAQRIRAPYMYHGCEGHGWSRMARDVRRCARVCVANDGERGRGTKGRDSRRSGRARPTSAMDGYAKPNAVANIDTNKKSPGTRKHRGKGEERGWMDTVNRYSSTSSASRFARARVSNARVCAMVAFEAFASVDASPIGIASPPSIGTSARR